MGDFFQAMLEASRYGLVLLSLLLMGRCIHSLLRGRCPRELWAWLQLDDEKIPVCHWENLLGRSRSCDVRIRRQGVEKIHAVLRRSDSGHWSIHKVFSAGEIWVNGCPVEGRGLRLAHGDLINLSGCCLYFHDLSSRRRQELEEERAAQARPVSQLPSLLLLCLFELCLLLQHCLSADKKYLGALALSFALLMALQCFCYALTRVMGRRGFEPELLAFYLSALGMSVAASSTPEDLYKQCLLLCAAVGLFLLLCWWMRRLGRTTALRIPMGLAALGLMALNVATADAVFGARNWLEIGGFSFQPSELVKVFYVYVGASTLDRLYRGRNLLAFIGFSAACVMALALIGDFGTALVFFVCFLMISFLRSGSIATVLLAVSGAGLAGFLAVSVKPYIAQRFAAWGHVWEDVYDKGFQQTRAMSAAASGGLLGKGAGAGWLQDIAAANTDMVFALVCEELGLIVALCMVLAVLVLAFFVLRSAGTGRSAYFSIAACAAMSIFLSQLALNVFGSLDLLPFTGVTFPFVSRGGSSLLSCWMLLAFLKGADNRPDGSFAVRSLRKLRNHVPEEPEEPVYEPEEDEEELEARFFSYDPDFEGDDNEDEWEDYRP